MTHESHNITKEEIKEGKGLAIVSYIIALIPFFAGDKHNKFIRFHAVQGMNIFITLLILWAANWIINGVIGTIVGTSMISHFSFSGVGASAGLFIAVNSIFALAYITIGVLDIVGLVYATQGIAKEVPIFDKFKFIKR